MSSESKFTVDKRLIDSFGRLHNNLRVSVTDRCNLRCFYCMPEHDPEFMPKSELLTFEETERVVRVGTGLGIDRVRLTGGEPLVRRELHKLIESIVSLPGIRDVGLTTNGIFLSEQAHLLRDAGLKRLNISLDALDPETFRKMTRRDGFDRVLAGIQAAKDAGFKPIKLNAVSVRGLTEDQIIPFGELAREGDIDVRFIEFMPLDAENEWERGKVLFAHEIIGILESEFGALDPQPVSDHRAPASQYRFRDGCGTIGLIASVSRPFCAGCNRFRLTADGKLRNCLFSLEETDVRGLLRSGGSDSEIAQAMQNCIAAKKEGHEINTARFVQPERPMHSIGG
ncbi:MAG: GTP 3',8-cyclase MoaA [Fuerstiella sp.]|nr:GTP 3',8-cyclase MoaA [Fuerstiella sp.]